MGQPSVRRSDLSPPYPGSAVRRHQLLMFRAVDRVAATRPPRAELASRHLTVLRQFSYPYDENPAFCDYVGVLVRERNLECHRGMRASNILEHWKK
jgi:hypothetical protein